MKRESSGPVLTTVFVDYDNIYLSLKRKNEDAAKRFAKDSGIWLQGLVSGELITPTATFNASPERRIVMNRCYGNPVPRRNAHDNSTDMNSFPFIRHHFLRSGFEVIDCPPLTAQLKNSADIRIVMDVRDLLNHDTYFDEFIILSGDADFTPVLHRLRAHARRTVVFANDHTAQPYTAISDGEIRESSLIALLTSGRTASIETTRGELAAPQIPAIDVEAARKAVISEVIDYVRVAPQAVPLETLADRAVRAVGRDKTVGTNWGGYGTFRDLLLAGLPEDLHLSDTPPYTVFDANRHISATGLISAPAIEAPRGREAMPDIAASEPQAATPKQQPQQSMASTPLQQQPAPRYQPAPQQRFATQQHTAATSAPAAPVARSPEPHAPLRQMAEPDLPPRRSAPPQQSAPFAPEPRREPAPSRSTQQPAAPAPRGVDQATQIQQSISRIHDACQAPALAPAEYRVLFDTMAQEIGGNGLQGAQTLANITQRAREFGLDIKRDDLRFILDVISESDPWFEQGTSASLFASRFRNFVVARCRSQGLSLSADELDLIEAWFAAPQPNRGPQYGRGSGGAQAAAAASPPAAPPQATERWWNLEESRQSINEQRGASPYAAQPEENEEELPRIVRSRYRG